jgi:type VI protein secretion system component VasF
MAEIKIERKKGIPVWAILLGLILLGVLAWIFLSGRDDARPNATGDNQTSSIELTMPEPALADLSEAA